MCIVAEMLERQRSGNIIGHVLAGDWVSEWEGKTEMKETSQSLFLLSIGHNIAT